MPSKGARTPYVKIGACSWNYHSWIGLVYGVKRSRSVEYLAEYAQKYSTAEVDSWFYKMPSRSEVNAYNEAVPPGFSFTIKAPRALTLVRAPGEGGRPNPEFLSPDTYAEFLDRVAPLVPRIDVVMLEFEYLNRQKMPGREAFMEALAVFAGRVPRDIPIGIESRNGNYLTADYFEFLARHGLVHVLSEKQYMPSIAGIAASYGHLLASPVVVRLLGGDRALMEERAGGKWDAIVEPRDTGPIVSLIKGFNAAGKSVIVNVNNHYEGSAPLTIAALERDLAAAR
ncbi:MAG: DUF72 domain-containing protein [Spirochaetes bacterium]|jgi:uncharacterized protein YecE (DUF72 family)|nr:DUF72 domain-containing protein [Spirochaetota bacterium]